MNSVYARLSAAALIVQLVICFKAALFSGNKPSQRTFLSPLRAIGTAVGTTKGTSVGTTVGTTSWSYKTLPEDFIVIEDRVLECYGQNTSTQAAPVDPLAPDMAYTELATVLGEEQLEKLIVLSQASQEILSGRESITLKISPALSKEERTKFHQNVRKIYPTVDSKTELKDKNNVEDSTYILIYPKGAKSLVNSNEGTDYDDRRNGRKKVVVQRWDRNKSDYLHFTVIKSMLSTSEMMDRLAKMTSMLPTRFEFCGSKDKRALTMQRVSSWRVDQGAVSRVSTDSMLVRDVCVATSPLHLGDLSGNFFAITLRKEPGSNTQNNLQINEDLSANDLINNFTDIASFPFMNIFGVQRFGAPLPSNPEVGKRLLRADYRGAVLMLLLAPSTEIELKIGGLDLPLLNSWLNTAQRLEDKENYDKDGNKIMHEKSSMVYFTYLSQKFEEYVEVIEDALAAGKFDENTDKVEEEKMGDEWNAMINAEEKNEHVKRESDVYDYDSRDTRETGYPEEDLGAVEGQSQSQMKNDRKTNKQNNAKKELKERLSTLSELLKGRPFDIPKSTSFLQKKIFNQFYEEMSRKCEGNLSRINFSRVFSVLPQALRQLFVNSYQSLLWNAVAAERVSSNVHNDIHTVNTVTTNTKNSKISKISRNSKTVKMDASNDVANNSENAYSVKSVVELKALLKERKQKVSGKKEELIARLIESDGPSMSKMGNADNINNDIDNSSNYNDDNGGKNGNNDSKMLTKGFLSSDTAVVGDIVLVGVDKRPLTAWHVAAQNISLNGHHIPVWSLNVLDKPVVVKEVESIVVNSNTPFNMNPNSPFYKDPNAVDRGDRGGDRGDRGRDSRDSRGGRGGRGGDRRNGGYVEEPVEEEVREIKACYHVITAEDAALRLYPIESVIVALPGSSVYNPPGGTAMRRVIEDRMQVLMSGTHHDKIFRLAGAYRHLVTVAKNIRIAAVLTNKNKIPLQSKNNYNEDGNQYDKAMNSIDEEIVYDEWSYNRENENTENGNDKKRKLRDENNEKPTPTPPLIAVEIPKWQKLNEKSELLPSAQFDYPFSGQVEKLWDNGIIPNLLFDIYSGSSSATQAKNIGVLPSGLFNTISPVDVGKIENKLEVETKINGKLDKINEDEVGEIERVEEVDGVRISFSLCASTYATTFLDHLTETVNKR